MAAKAMYIVSLASVSVLTSLQFHNRVSAQKVLAGGQAAGEVTVPLVGTWRVSFTRPPSRGYALVTFTSDGTSVRTTDRSPVMSPSHGAWLQTGDREFQATWHAFKFDTSGAHVGNQKAIFRVRTSEDGNSLTGVGIGTTYSLDGKLVESETAEGPFEGTRISVAEHYTKR